MICIGGIYWYSVKSHFNGDDIVKANIQPSGQFIMIMHNSSVMVLQKYNNCQLFYVLLVIATNGIKNKRE